MNYDKYIVYGCCFAIMIFMIALFGTVSASNYWIDEGWCGLKCSDISNNVSGYSMKIVVGNNSGGDVDCDGEAKSDFGDIRFTGGVGDGNTSNLSYWMENYTSGVQATFWVNISDSDELCIIFGNDSASSIEDGDDTFLFFDDFDDASIDTDKWDSSGAHESGGLIYVADTDSLITDNTFQENLRIRGLFNMYAHDSAVGISDSSPKDNNNRIIMFSTTPSDWDEFYTLCIEGGTSDQLKHEPVSPDYNNWLNWEITWLSNNVKFYYDEGLLDTVTDTNDILDGSEVYLYFDNWGDGGNISSDWVFLSKFASTEPSFDVFSSSISCGECKVDLGVFYYNKTYNGIGGDGNDYAWANHTWNIYYCEDNTSYWNGNDSIISKVYFEDNAYLDIEYGRIGVYYGIWYNWTDVGFDEEYFYINDGVNIEVPIYYNWTECTDRYINFTGNFSYGDGETGYIQWKDILIYDNLLCGGNGTYWLNVTYNTSNKNKGVIVNTSFTKDNNNWTQNVTVGDNDWLFISAFAIEDEQLSLFVTMTLFCFFFYTGYTSEKRSGGVLMLFSGFTLIGFSFLVSGILDALLIIPLITPISILVIILGIRKWLYPVENEKTKSEGT